MNHHDQGGALHHEPAHGSRLELSVPGWNSLILSSDAGDREDETLSNFRNLPPGKHRISWRGGADSLLDFANSGRNRDVSPGQRDYFQREGCARYFAPAGSGSSAGRSETIPRSMSIAFSRTSAVLEASCLIRIGVAITTLVSSTSR